jgi:hypothetical protein
MEFQRVNRSSPEKVFVSVLNSYSTAALSNGQYVAWDVLTDSDGVSVTIPQARTLGGGFDGAGVVASGAIAVADYGLVQIYGYHAAARVRSFTIGIPAIAKGTPLYANIAGSVFCLENAVTHQTGLRVWPIAIALAANSSFTTLAKPIFIKAM